MYILISNPTFSRVLNSIKSMDSMDSLCIIEMTGVLYPPMTTYEWVLWDLYIGGYRTPWNMVHTYYLYVLATLEIHSILVHICTYVHTYLYIHMYWVPPMENNYQYYYIYGTNYVYPHMLQQKSTSSSSIMDNSPLFLWTNMIAFFFKTHFTASHSYKYT